MQSLYGAASSSTLYGLGISDVSFPSQSFPTSQSLADLTADTSSPETFRHNIHLVHQQVLRIQSLARTAMSEIEHVYHPGRSPTTAYLTGLQEALLALLDLLRTSGVGALPLLPTSLSSAQPQPPLPTEEQLMQDLAKSIEEEYGKYGRVQESAAVVFNLLSAAESSLRR